MKKKIDCTVYKFNNLEFYQFPDENYLPQVFLNGRNILTNKKQEKKNLKFYLKKENKDYLNEYLYISYSGFNKNIRSQTKYKLFDNIKKIFVNRKQILFITEDNVLYTEEKLGDYYVKNIPQKISKKIINIEKSEEIKNIIFYFSLQDSFLLLHTKKGNLYGYGDNYCGIFGNQKKIEFLDKLKKLNKKHIDYLLGSFFEAPFKDFFISYKEGNTIKYVTSGLHHIKNNVLFLTEKPVKVEKDDILFIPGKRFEKFYYIHSIFTYDLKKNRFTIFPNSEVEKRKRTDRLILPEYIENNIYIYIDYVDIENYIEC